MKKILVLVIALLSPCSAVLRSSHAEEDLKFELRNYERVVFLGNSFFERALSYGHIEIALALSAPSSNITFRNLGWDGDTVFGHSRAGGRRRGMFGDPAEGYVRMVEHVKSLEPTLIFLAYGWNESFEDAAGLEPFHRGLSRLVQAIRAEDSQIVLLSPIPLHDGFGTHLDSGRNYISKRNQVLGLYRDEILEVAKVNRCHFVDLFDLFEKSIGPISDNGVHLNDAGYRVAANAIVDALNLPPPRANLNSPEVREIRQSIVKKNTLYFHRWRPRNDAFVYGERKDEQKIAQTEPAQFEPFIAKEEKRIRDFLVRLGGPK